MKVGYGEDIEDRALVIYVFCNATICNAAPLWDGRLWEIR